MVVALVVNDVVVNTNGGSKFHTNQQFIVLLEKNAVKKTILCIGLKLDMCHRHRK